MAEDAQMKLRVDQYLKEFIENEAKANYRTINGEVVYRLEQSKLINRQALVEQAHEFACILASALVDDPDVEIHKIVHGFRQPSLKGIQQAFQSFLYRMPHNRDSLKMEETADGIRFYNRNTDDEYIISKDNPYPDGAYTINHLSRILEKLYFLPTMFPKNKDA